MTKFVFVDPKGKLLTQRIAQTDCKPTVAWLGMMRPDLNLLDNMVGSTGLAPTSSNIDLVYDTDKATPDELHTMLARWAKSYDKLPSHFTLKHNNVVYFKCPIAGTPDKGFVQVNLYPSNNLEFSRAIMRCKQDSAYKCRERNQLLNSIAYTAGYKLNPLSGLHCIKTKRLITSDLTELAKIVLGNSDSVKSIESVEGLLALLAKDSMRTSKIEKFTKHLEHHGIPFIDDFYVPQVHFMAKLRDRIVNRGMQPIFESARIEHLEDLIFDRGVGGVENAIAIIQDCSKNPDLITAKLDGKICLVWGRKPTGEFVLTDKSGFHAKGYDGHCTCVEDIAQMISRRGRGREPLIQLFEKLFPILERATPKNFKGFVKGDLMFHQQPEEIKGALHFKPNLIEYDIAVDSDLGRKIKDRDVCIAAHTWHEDKDSDAVPINQLKHHQSPELAILMANDFAHDKFKANQELVQQISDLTVEYGEDISTLFNPMELRAQKITDLPKLCKQYINTRIHNDYDALLPRFMLWLENHCTPIKFKRILEFLENPSSNQDALSAVFTIFLLLHELKTDTLTQLDRKNPGNEGWVLNSPSGQAKLVDRFNFSAANRRLWDSKKNS